MQTVRLVQGETGPNKGECGVKAAQLLSLKNARAQRIDWAKWGLALTSLLREPDPEHGTIVQLEERSADYRDVAGSTPAGSILRLTQNSHHEVAGLQC